MLSVIITSRNRCHDLARTLDFLTAMTPAPSEITVHLDGCTDDSAVMVREKHPGVKLSDAAIPVGSISARDKMIRASSNEYILSLDDDSHPEDMDFVKKVPGLFARYPEAAVIWFPQRSEEFPESLKINDAGPDQLTGTYSSSGACLRKSIYLTLPGYPPVFYHAYEEPDYALQCISKGWSVVYCTQQTIRHYYSPRNRNEKRTHQFHSRNEQWSIWMRCPALILPLLCIFRFLRQTQYAAKRGVSWLLQEPTWWFKVMKGLPAVLRLRRPVSLGSYWKWLSLLRHPEKAQDVTAVGGNRSKESG